MNWKVRLRNPVFWVQIVVSAFAAVLAYAGLTAADLTTWESVGALLCNAVRNPYCLFLVLSSVWNAVNDPTTKGVADSERARKYDMPSDEKSKIPLVERDFSLSNGWNMRNRRGEQCSPESDDMQAALRGNTPCAPLWDSVILLSTVSII